jgi:hypothetical protein
MELAPNLIKYIHIKKTFPSDLISNVYTSNCIQTVRLRVLQHIIKDLKASCYVIGEKMLSLPDAICTNTSTMNVIKHNSY